ncbi:MAG: GTP cyclohydrolase I FolE [SAR202 cluster bacterium]|nr:GTP cyclohydrolase I FolE [SAR202 cluster bacterium]
MIKEEKIRQSVAAILAAIGEDTSREGLKDTPSRVARMYSELFSGVGLDPAEAFTALFEDSGESNAVVLRDVSFFSICEHHLLPFYGAAQIGYIPKGKVCGASKLIRALEIVARRPQLQERMTSQLADAIQLGLDCHGVAVIVEAEHMCMTMRGVRNQGSRIMTSAVRGPFPKGQMSSAELMNMLRAA